MLNKDFRDMLQCFSAEKVEYLLIGGYAMAAHGFPRATKDIDLWVMANLDNSRRIYAALVEFGAPISQISEDDFSHVGNVFQIGVAPRRIDITTVADGVSFDECSQRAIYVEWGGVRLPVISKNDLIKNKAKCARPQDLADIAALRQNREMDQNQDS